MSKTTALNKLFEMVPIWQVHDPNTFATWQGSKNTDTLQYLKIVFAMKSFDRRERCLNFGLPPQIYYRSTQLNPTTPILNTLSQSHAPFDQPVQQDPTPTIYVLFSFGSQFLVSVLIFLILFLDLYTFILVSHNSKLFWPF